MIASVQYTAVWAIQANLVAPLRLNKWAYCVKIYEACLAISDDFSRKRLPVILMSIGAVCRPRPIL